MIKNQLMIEVSIGEVVDKYTILQIKRNKIRDEIKLKNIKNVISISLAEAIFFGQIYIKMESLKSGKFIQKNQAYLNIRR